MAQGSPSLCNVSKMRIKPKDKYFHNKNTGKRQNHSESQLQTAAIIVKRTCNSFRSLPSRNKCVYAIEF